MSPSTKRSAALSRRTPRPGHFEPWQEDAAKKFGVSLPIVAERFEPRDVERLERVFKGRTLAAFPLARELGEEHCFLRAFLLPGVAVPFLVENLNATIEWWESMADAPHRAVGARELSLIARQGRRLAASLRSLEPSVLDALFWEGEADAVARSDAFMATLDEIAGRAAGDWCFPQYTPGEHKAGLEWAVCGEMALHQRLSAYRDGLTARVLRFAYASARVPGGSSPFRVLQAFVKIFDKAHVAAAIAARRAYLEGIFRAGPKGDPYEQFAVYVVGGPAMLSSPPGRPPV